MILIKRHLLQICSIIMLFSCGVDHPDLSKSGGDISETTYSKPTGLEIWINSNRQDVQLFRLRKANGASRMRLLVEMADSLHFSLFLTPLVVGNHVIESGNVFEDMLKFSRTHCELKRNVDETHFYLYEVDTTLTTINRVEITEIDTVQSMVRGSFRCQMKMVNFEGEPNSQQLQINGVFNTSYRD